MSTSSIENPKSCMKCGTCCRKGGPTLHQVDRSLVENGLIPARYLFTMRAGERVFDNLNKRLAVTDQEMIKIRGTGVDWTCVFFDSGRCDCRIYEHRPSQCNAQKCWAPEDLEALAASTRLTRSNLLSGVRGLWDLIIDHEQRCPYATVKHSADRLYETPDDPSAIGRILEMARYDAALRDSLIQSKKAEPDMLDFLLGRPLAETLPGFGFIIERIGPKLRLSFSLHRYLALKKDE